MNDITRITFETDFVGMQWDALEGREVAPRLRTRGEETLGVSPPKRLYLHIRRLPRLDSEVLWGEMGKPASVSVRPRGCDTAFRYEGYVVDLGPSSLGGTPTVAMVIDVP